MNFPNDFLRIKYKTHAIHSSPRLLYYHSRTGTSPSIFKMKFKICDLTAVCVASATKCEKSKKKKNNYFHDSNGKIPSSRRKCRKRIKCADKNGILFFYSRLSGKCGRLTERRENDTQKHTNQTRKKYKPIERWRGGGGWNWNTCSRIFKRNQRFHKWKMMKNEYRKWIAVHILHGYGVHHQTPTTGIFSFNI